MITVCVCVCVCVFRTAWVQKIKVASEEFIETEKKKREKAYQGLFLHSHNHTDGNQCVDLWVNRSVCVFVCSTICEG